MLGVLLSFVRWWCLVRALGVPIRLADTIRISFWGYLFNLPPLGIVGGDLVRTVMLGHEHPKYRAKALASVVVDRVIGLYELFLVASAAILVTGFWRINVAYIDTICLSTFTVTVIGTVGLGVVMGPEKTVGPAVRACGRIPRVGHPLESLIDAVRMYRNMPRVMIVSLLITVGVHCSLAVGCYLIACGLPGNHLSLAQHFVVIPLSAAMQVIPFPLGPAEFALDYLYAAVPVAGPPIAKGQGLVVVLAYRVAMILIAATGVFYYFSNRREMAEVIHEAELEELSEQTP